MRRAGLAIALAVVALSVAVGASYYYASHNGPSGSDHSQCSDPDSISSHVYNPYRLQIIKSCITASGIVDNVIQEGDGDQHTDPHGERATNHDTRAQTGPEHVCADVAEHQPLA